MGAQVVDYRVSTLVVLCKDCGHDVGLYPARHKCQPVERPAMPALPTQYTKSNILSSPSLDLNNRTMSSGSSSSITSSSPSPSLSSVEGNGGNKWSSSRQKTNLHIEDNEESVYFNNFAANLPGSSNEATTTATPSGKKLWGKVRQNEKWKQLNEKNDKPKQSGKLWGKLIQATQTMADKIPSKDDRDAESDEDDWEGETHVSRILREHYEKKHMPLPPWLFDHDVQMKRQPSSSARNREPMAALDPEMPRGNPMRTPSRRRLWEQNPDDPKKISSRERERQELRQAPIKHQPEERYHNEYRDENDRYSNNRRREDDYHDHRDYGQRPREEDRYNSNRNYNEDRYHSHNDYEPPRRKSRDQPRYEQDHSYAQQPSARSPPRSARSNSTNRQARYEPSGYDDSSYYQPKSERSARGYSDRYQDNHRAADLDDYYYNSPTDHTRHNIPSASKDRAARYHASPIEASSKSRGRRYGNDSEYF